MNSRQLKEWGRAFFLALIIASLMYIFCWPSTISGLSMKPEYSSGDRVFICRFLTLLGDIDYGDLVVCRNEFSDTEKQIIKRVVGLPGDLVEINGGQVYINDDVYKESYISGPTVGEVAVVLGDDEYYLLGDNRSISADSRAFGPYAADKLVGVAFFRWYPLNKIGIIQNLQE